MTPALIPYYAACTEPRLQLVRNLSTRCYVRDAVLQDRKWDFAGKHTPLIGLGHVVLRGVFWSSDLHGDGASSILGLWSGCAMDVVTEEQFDADICVAGGDGDGWRDDSEDIMDPLERYWHEEDPYGERAASV
jgi:hypothetical protein